MEALALIVAELGREPLGNRHGIRALSPDLPDELPPLDGSVRFVREILKLAPQRNLVAVEPDPRLPLVEIRCLSDELGERLQRRVGETQERVVDEQELLFALGERAEQRPEGHGLLPHRDEHAEVKPVGLFARQRRHLEVRHPMQLCIRWRRTRDAHLDAREQLQRRHHVREKRRRVNPAQLEAGGQQVFEPGFRDPLDPDKLRRQQLRKRGLVRPGGALVGPPQVEPVPAPPRRSQHDQCGIRLGHHQGAVCTFEGERGAQLGDSFPKEVLALGTGNHDRRRSLRSGDQRDLGLAQTVGHRGERNHPLCASTRRAAVGEQVEPVSADRAATAKPRGLAVDAEHRREHEAVVRACGDLKPQFGRGVQPHRRSPGLADERDPELIGLCEHCPERGTEEVVEEDPVGILPKGDRLGSSVQRVQLPKPALLRLFEAAPGPVMTDVGPGERGASPPAFRAQRGPHPESVLAAHRAPPGLHRLRERPVPVL
ncbi:hypothetical protein ACI1US_01495 [Leucobacter sp. BZR 635]